MTFLKTAWVELLGMFVDDGALALLVIVLISGIAVAVKGLGLSALTGGLLLLPGCLAVLATSLVRATRGR